MLQFLPPGDHSGSDDDWLDNGPDGPGGHDSEDSFDECRKTTSSGPTSGNKFVVKGLNTKLDGPYTLSGTRYILAGGSVVLQHSAHHSGWSFCSAMKGTLYTKCNAHTQLGYLPDHYGNPQSGAIYRTTKGCSALTFLKPDSTPAKPPAGGDSDCHYDSSTKKVVCSKAAPTPPTGKNQDCHFDTSAKKVVCKPSSSPAASTPPAAPTPPKSDCHYVASTQKVVCDHPPTPKEKLAQLQKELAKIECDNNRKQCIACKGDGPIEEIKTLKCKLAKAQANPTTPVTDPVGFIPSPSAGSSTGGGSSGSTAAPTPAAPNTGGGSSGSTAAPTPAAPNTGGDCHYDSSTQKIVGSCGSLIILL